MTPSELCNALQRPVTVDLFDSVIGLVTAASVTIDRTPADVAPDQVVLTTSTGHTGALVTVEPHPKFWYLVNLVCEGFTATVHASDLVYL